MRLAAGMRRGGYAPSLVMPFPALEKADLRLRRGQTSLWVAGSGVGKSQLLANIAQRGGFPVSYWSADTDQYVATIRTLALWMGRSTRDVEQMWLDPAWAGHIKTALAKGSHIEWIFTSPITPRLVRERMFAFAEKHGQYPHLFVVDNLSNTVEDLNNEFSEQKQVMTSMQQLARETGAHIAMLSHAKGEYEGGTKPIPRAGALNNLFKLPELGVTLYKADENTLAVAVVKNRDGRDDPRAERAVRLPIDFSQATVKGWA